MGLKTAFMFPGQGSQQVGMGRELAEQLDEVGAIYRRANEIVGYDLAEVCFSGPEAELNTTKISQPAIFVTSVACMKALRGGRAGAVVGGDCDWATVEPEVCLGLSLGEYTALHVAGAMGFEEGLRLVQLRGASMQEAAEARSGAMVSILGLDEEGVNRLIEAVSAEGIKEADGGQVVLSAVNFNCPGQIVVSGTVKACERLAARAEEFGAGRAVPLKVAGAFHTELMASAAAKLGKALNECHFAEPCCEVLANVDAKPYDGAGNISEKLLQQLVSPVRWQESVERLISQGVERFVEIGPGRVLTGLVKKISRAMKTKVEIVTVNGNLS